MLKIIKIPEAMQQKILIYYDTREKKNLNNYVIMNEEKSTEQIVCGKWYNTRKDVEKNGNITYQHGNSSENRENLIKVGEIKGGKTIWY